MAQAPLLLGHRGTRSSGSVRENTLAAFDLALEHGCDGFEFDVRLTADGQAVVCHDARFRGAFISKASARELGRLPRLEEVLARYAKRAFLDIELKVPGLTAHVLRVLAEHIPERGYVVSSFLPGVIRELKALRPSIPLGLIADRRRQLDVWPDLAIDCLVVHHSLITADLARRIQDAHKTLLAWTVNDRASMLRLADWGIAGLISDQTELLARSFKVSD